MSNYITLVDIGMAYRKAKVDVFYSYITDRLQFIDFEKNLLNNFKYIQKAIAENDDSFKTGDWIIFPKKLSDTNSFVDTNYTDYVDVNNKVVNSDTTAEFRLMAKPSIEFYVLSALWIEKVGSRYDSKLSNNAYGNRLRRNKINNFNNFSIGSFVPYLQPYRRWKENGIFSMRHILNKKKSLFAITADIESFYHSVEPDFLLDENFLSLIGLVLSDDDILLTRFLIDCIKRWAKNTPLKTGLPVGLPASSIIANMSLYQMDKVIIEELRPNYYGRYVDDILIVIESTLQFKKGSDVLDWLINHSNNTLIKKDNKILYNPVYIKKSKIAISENKTKCFALGGYRGKSILSSLEKTMNAKTSEWRSLPELSENPSTSSSKLFSALNKNGEPVDSLNKADFFSMHKVEFPLILRAFESYERNLHLESWRQHRELFLHTIETNMMVLPHFFDFASFLPRILRLVIACEEFSHLQIIIKKLEHIYEEISICKIIIKSCRNTKKDLCLKLWKLELQNIIDENIAASFPITISKDSMIKWKKIDSNFKYFTIPKNIGELKKLYISLYSSDLANNGLRFSTMKQIYCNPPGIPGTKNLDFACGDHSAILEKNICDSIKELCKEINFVVNNKYPFGIIYPTRPFNLDELYLILKDPFDSARSKLIKKYIFALRGFPVKNGLPLYDDMNKISVKRKSNSNQVNIALACWKTEDDSITAAISRFKDPDHSRYQRLIKIINDILISPSKIDYVVFPEISIPAKWFVVIANRLKNRKITFIAGIEYIHIDKQKISNQVWASLFFEGLDFPRCILYKQEKQKAAIHEENDLYKISGKNLSAIQTWKIPPIISHGGFCFSILICSELTNINYRSHLRGNTDAIFVLEYNKDIDTFNSIVESSAYDVHAFIIQCNDRKYGDSRIRAPYKDKWMRDIVRIKGGLLDYFVVGEINIHQLRQFQSFNKSPEQPFKPVPDGFVINYKRKILPKSIKQDDK